MNDQVFHVEHQCMMFIEAIIKGRIVSSRKDDCLQVQMFGVAYQTTAKFPLEKIRKANTGIMATLIMNCFMLSDSLKANSTASTKESNHNFIRKTLTEAGADVVLFNN